MKQIVSRAKHYLHMILNKAKKWVNSWPVFFNKKTSWQIPKFSVDKVFGFFLPTGLDLERDGGYEIRFTGIKNPTIDPSLSGFQAFVGELGKFCDRFSEAFKELCALEPITDNLFKVAAISIDRNIQIIKNIPNLPAHFVNNEFVYTPAESSWIFWSLFWMTFIIIVFGFAVYLRLMGFILQWLLKKRPWKCRDLEEHLKKRREDCKDFWNDKHYETWFALFTMIPGYWLGVWRQDYYVFRTQILPLIYQLDCVVWIKSFPAVKIFLKIYWYILYILYGKAYYKYFNEEKILNTYLWCYAYNCAYFLTWLTLAIFWIALFMIDQRKGVPKPFLTHVPIRFCLFENIPQAWALIKNIVFPCLFFLMDWCYNNMDLIILILTIIANSQGF